MTRAISCRRVGTRQAAAGRRFVRSVVRGVGALAVAFAIVAGALSAAGWILSVAVDAREDRRSTIGLPPPNRLAWMALPASAVAATAPYIARNWPDDDETMEVSTGSVTPQTVALPSSGFLGGKSDDPIFARMMGHSAYQFEQRFSAVTDRFERLVRPAIVPPMILPHKRPQVASLPPAIGIRIPDDDPQLARTAIYDITAKAVYMPNGEKLEAHSGLGQYMDDPKHLKLRMRGVTPPNTYRLRMREALFHGVEAIRMLPEDRDAMFGRDGILAHTYMLGPTGQSNGCVSFKDYPKFLAAFKRGEVNRMIVVVRLPQPPAAYARRHGGTRTAKAL